MKTLKKWLTVTLLAVASLGLLAACGQKSSDKNTVTVGIMTQNDESKAIWNQISKTLKKEGVTLKLKTFSDYSQPNKALANKEVDLNAFQHYNFLNNWNKENKGSLVTIADTLISPIRLYSGTKDGKNKYTSVSQIPDGATIAVPNDATNESRALYLLQSAGLIKINVSGTKLATIANIKSNPKNLKIKELDASQTARSLTSVAAAVINNNYATVAKVDYKKSLYTEAIDKNSHQWINVIAARKDYKKAANYNAIKKLVKAYQSKAVKKIIKEKSDGLDQAAWDLKVD